MKPLNYRRYLIDKSTYLILITIIFGFLLNCQSLVFGQVHPLQKHRRLKMQHGVGSLIREPFIIKAKRSHLLRVYQFKRDVIAKSLNLGTGEETEYTLHGSLQVDDHNVPTFLFLPDNKILTFIITTMVIFL